jgi:serine/threonine protein kinase
MRDLIRQILQGYKSLNLEGQDEGYVLFTGEEPDTQQPVAIKILPRLLGSDPQIAARFNGLARTIRQLNHPNIASIRKVGEEAGLPYIITRTLEKGHSLTTKLDQPWAVDTAADIVMQVGQALDHAYRKGVVHGTLNPDNVVVQEDGRVLVTDFGLGEMMEIVGAQTKQATSEYLAPERMAGKTADARADVYSLAALLYSMVTKRTPQVVKGEVLPPSRFNPDVPEAMDQVIVKALASDPDARYPDAKTFLAALGATTLVPPAKKAQPVTPSDRCPRCGSRNQTGRFCRKCGHRLEQRTPAAPSQLLPRESVLEEPIQITKVEVGHVEVGKGVELKETDFARPMPVATDVLDFEFPEPLEMPRLDVKSLWSTLDDALPIAMPEPPPMPTIDWAEAAPPMPEVPTIEDIPPIAESQRADDEETD